MMSEPANQDFAAIQKLSLSVGLLANHLREWSRYHRGVFLDMQRPPRHINPRKYVWERERVWAGYDPYFNPSLNAIGNCRYLLFTVLEIKEKLLVAAKGIAPDADLHEVRATLEMVTATVGVDTITESGFYLSDHGRDREQRRLFSIRVIRDDIKLADSICSQRLLEHQARLGLVATELLEQSHSLDETTVPALVDDCRRVLKLLGKDAKRQRVRNEVGKRSTDVFAALDYLESTGEYCGPRSRPNGKHSGNVPVDR